ncbi:MAG: cation transporter [Acidobacteriaceae bacterium]|nr:cation transporter [Acidobacteriaceae bacterium]
MQVATLVWMTTECGLALYAAKQAHSPMMLTFGSDSLIEWLSATVVLAQFIGAFAISEAVATRVAAVLLYLLAVVVVIIAGVSLSGHLRPETSFLGMGASAAALLVMPLLAHLKRREARSIGNSALAADAVQSATCAYLAALTLLGLGVNAVFHVPWFDSTAALIAVPLLLKEAREAWRGNFCSC